MQTGSFDPLASQADMVALISEVTGAPAVKVNMRLEKERGGIGSSVKSAFNKAVRDHGAKRFVYNEAMERFYENTDSFLYELAVWNLNGLKQEMGAWCCDWITRTLGPSKVLSIGDGLGFECLRVAEAGHDVTYFEVPGYSAEFAKLLFARKGADVRQLTDPEKIPGRTYDVIVCLDVLEHISDPPTFVEMLKGYLKPGGVFIVHAPFYMIHPNYPTHVAESRRFSGDMKLYTDAGFRVLGGRPLWNPIVLQAPGGEKISSSVLGKFRLMMGKPYLMAGRKSVKPFRMIHSIKRKHQHWFGDESGF